MPRVGMSIGKSQWALVMEEMTIPPCSALLGPQQDPVSSLGLPSTSKTGMKIPKLGQEVRGGAERARALRGSRCCLQVLIRKAQGRAGLVLGPGGARRRGKGPRCGTGSSDMWIFVIRLKPTRVTTRRNGARG